MVIGLKRAGWSIRQIAADTHLGASTVHRLWRRWLEQGNVAIYRNAGATRVTSARVDRRILRQAVAAPQATCTAILQHVQDTLDHSISTRTIFRRLVANGLHSCRPLRRLPLTPPNRRQRLEWCRARSTWMTEWHRVVFSDESRFCLSSDSRRVRVWRRRGERSKPAAIVERPTVRQRGIMVWGAIAYDSRSPLLRIQGTMTAQRYVDDVLRPVTLPYLQGVPNAPYQQDNARPHTARISQQALQDVQMLPWPPYSPDLSPIEHVWDIIGRRLHALPHPRSEDELWQMVEREWRAIPQDAIRTLIDSLPRRVAACIAVRGQPIGKRGRSIFDQWEGRRLVVLNREVRTGSYALAPKEVTSALDLFPSAHPVANVITLDYITVSRQDKEMELNQDPIGVKSDGPTETMERRQEVRESEPAGERQEVTGRETTAPLADAVNQLSALLTRVKISDGAEATISPFDGTYSATQFFQTFDRKMEDASMGEQEKLLRLPNYLVRQPLELFRKLRLADRSYFQVRQILLDLYPESSEASFAKYFAMKLTGQANLETYYREKTAMGLQLGLPQEVILETLTEGLPFNDQRLVRVVPPENLGEWFRLVQRIHGPSVHGMHLFRRPTASSAARDTGTANADVDQSRRPTKKSGQCKRSQNHQFRFHNDQVKPETPQPSSPFETEVGSLNQLTVKLFLAPNVSCPFLIDTGASLSIVPYNIYHMLKTHLPNLTLEGHSLHLKTLNGFAKTMGKLSIPLTIGQISRKENFHVVNAPLPFGILSINSLHKFRLTIDFNKCTIFQLGAPLSTLSYHFNHVSNVCTYWQCQAMSQKIFPASQLSAYDNHCVHSLRKTHLSTCPFFTKANCLFYMPSNNQTTTTSTYEPVQNAPTQRDNSHTKNIGDHTPLHNSHMTNPHNELDTHTNTQQNPLPHAYYNTTPNTHYTPQFTTLLQRYTHIFSQDKFNVPCLRIPPVKIPTNSEKIITIRPYRVPICDQQEIRNQIQQMLENGIIEQSFSPFSSPVTLVTKRDKTKRFCIDYRKVNELISSDVHPLPRIEDILDRLAQAKYFSTADISSAYWQVPIHPDSRPLLAFTTLEGLYQPTRLPFGLKTSPQIYKRAISQVLQRHGLDCVAHYFDDFIIYSNSLEEHQNHLRQFFAFCEAEKLQLNFVKCEFFKQSIDFLGYTITAGTITPLTRNTDIIHAIQQPHNRKTLQSFLGAVNVYNKFIPEYARLRAPLNNLLKKDVVWNWNEVCQKAFIDLKGKLTQHPILHLYKEGLPCQVYCDASTLGIAGILKQVHPDGNVYPAQYFSRTLRPHEKNYSISELECLAIVESVEKFRIYLMGRKFTIFSDHHALQWLKTIKNPSGRLFRWSLRLSSYEYEVRYIKGKLQYEADLLSRNPFCGFLDATLIKTHQPPPSKESSLTIDHNGLHTVSRKGVTKIILPKPLIQQLLQTVHTQYNHPGISQMSRLISTQYYWQGMSKDIKQKVKTCPTCQLTKRPVGPTYGELSQPPESKEPFDLLSLDTIAGFAKYGNTKIYLHVVVDHFSRYAGAFPSKSTSTTTYQQVLKRVFQDGSPKRLLTDRAPAFTSPKFRSFLLNRNIHPLLTTSNNPQANGLCERLNATLTGKLRLLHLENPKVAWTKLVKKVTLIYNKTPHFTTGFPPIYLMFGILPPEISNHNTPYPDIDKARKIAHTRTQNKHLQDKNTYDQRHKQPHFEVGDLVFKPTSSEPFRHLDPAIFATRRFASLFPDVKSCKPDNQLNHITPLPKDIKQENCEPTNHSNSTLNKESAPLVSKPSLPYSRSPRFNPILFSLSLFPCGTLPFNYDCAINHHKSPILQRDKHQFCPPKGTTVFDFQTQVWSSTDNEFPEWLQGFPTCTKCQLATPNHIIDCIGSSIGELYSSPADTINKIYRLVILI
ncbi:hypothetical protein LAZ67_7002452 [Cordylochernes scorpioides]|uniref:RNA-directed DNA polymerase n=1 Tax=Cordylochernes scorpioides TaxID=51811 RepID=A0ABY6KNQ5_9ARAC|nr:hypothetical protein LAZ67_7002452 [Cordylochernes scorpioides]